MNKIFVMPLVAIIAVTASCGNNNDKSGNKKSSNPFAEASKLAYQTPAFDQISDDDFKPALEEGMKIQLEEIQKIADNTEAPTFENTMVALEKSGQMLTRARNVFDALTSANTNPKLQKVQEEIAPKQAAHRDAIYLNSKLFKRIQVIYNNSEQLKLDPESKRLVEYYEQQFELAGAKLSDAAQSQLKKLNEEEASLSARFSNQLLAANKAGALIISNKDELAGLSQGELAAAAQAAKSNKQEGKWLIPLQNTTQQPLLQSLTNRTTREKLFKAAWNRAEKQDTNDTRSTIIRIAKIRAEKARLMGFPDYATWKLQDQMAKTPAAVDAFFAQLVPAATAKAKMEAADIQAQADLEKSGFKIQPWDWDYYADKVRKQKYDLDESQVKPYFELNKVLEKGVFYAANLLYGITFTERHDLPVYQKDVRVFEVFDKDKSTIGLFYCDYFKRDNKSGGAWMSNFVGQSELMGTKPVIYNVCNFTKPAKGQPALISFSDVVTMFHEFGHGLHGLFASQKYPALSGANVARDFVEFPSQFNEHWALSPQVFKNYAVHYKTGQPIPQVLVEKIKKAATFNQGYNLTEILSAASLDMAWHKLKLGDPVQSTDNFEQSSLHRLNLDLQEVPPRYRTSYFSHIWGGEYGAGYYAYLWTEMLDDDAYSWFEENGGLTRTNGQRFRDMILSKGNTEDYGKMFRDFRGHDPKIGPMEKNRGLITK
ncbi:dipeptidyl carboxypeptidase II [Pedobacter lusitanus]|uniref:Dipeptidyl carboxypeptidase n=1 Tax=Pedobacter lusitanus TaxID=1503925 RepID=A0A0D0FX71_9SPHI|nr:peptidyl-dipeptidase Dcp [Pedobacter lusitanus]KIO77114.1 dipeptidyl carboxypeptidase II [Pedobacter lusitanus]